MTKNLRIFKSLTSFWVIVMWIGCNVKKVHMKIVMTSFWLYLCLMNKKEKLVSFNKNPSVWQWKIEFVIIQMCGGKKQSVSL